MILTKYRKFFKWYGWIGAIGLLVGYFLISTGYLEVRTISFQILSMVSGLGLALTALVDKSYPNAGLNFVYTLIGIVTLLTLLI